MEFGDFRRDLAIVLTALHRKTVTPEVAYRVLNSLSPLMETYNSPADIIKRLRETLAIAIGQLSSPQVSQVADLYYLSGMTLTRISLTFNMSEPTAVRYTQRAKEELAALLWFSLHPIESDTSTGRKYVMTSLETALRRNFRLTGREVELAQMLIEPNGDYLSLRDIADMWVTSINTVKSHRRNVYKKLKVHSKEEAIAKLLQLKNSLNASQGNHLS